MIDKKINILIAIESFYDGGAEMFAIRLANELAEKTNLYFFELYPYRSKAKKQKKNLRMDKKKTIQLGKNFLGDILHRYNNRSRIKNKIFDIYNYFNKRRLISIIKRSGIQIVHSHSWETDLFFSKLKDLIGFKLVSSLHGHYELLKQKGEYLDTCSKFALDKMDRVVYLSTAHIETLNSFNIDERKRKKIFHGLDFTPQDSLTFFHEGEVLKCILVARGIPEKGWKEAIEAFLKLQKKYPQKVQLHLIGESDYLKELKDVYQSDVICFHGYREDVMSFIRQAHIGLLPSFYKAESLPNAVIEYLVCGKPVIATRIGAIEEMIEYENKRAGVIIELNNSKVGSEDIVSAIEIYLSNPELVAQHSSIALIAAKKFEMENCVQAYSKLYSEVLSQ
jgi:glycosyltransferase involved in cell wall biosynthesis